MIPPTAFRSFHEHNTYIVTGLLEFGEVGILASNRNFKGCMGFTEAEAYLISPEIVDSDAFAGKITGPS